MPMQNPVMAIVCCPIGAPVEHTGRLAENLSAIGNTSWGQ